jgi:hypothetical protein
LGGTVAFGTDVWVGCTVGDLIGDRLGTAVRVDVLVLAGVADTVGVAVRGFFGVAVEVGTAVVGTTVGVEVGFAFGVTVDTGVAVKACVGFTAGVWVAVLVAGGVGVGITVWVGVRVRVVVSVAVGVSVAVPVAVGVGVFGDWRLIIATFDMTVLSPPLCLIRFVTFVVVHWLPTSLTVNWIAARWPVPTSRERAPGVLTNPSGGSVLTTASHAPSTDS